jgi:putative transposase
MSNFRHSIMSKKSQDNDFDYSAFEADAIKRLLNGESLGGKEGILAPLVKRILEAGLEGEMDGHLQEDSQPNRRNGKGRKKVKTGQGEIELSTPRDRNGSFEPQMVRKRQRTLGDGLDNKVLALYSKGFSYQNIQSYLEESFGLEVSTGKLSAITDKIIPEIREWQDRPLEPIYCFVWLDAIHFKVREDGRVINKAVYCVLGVDQDGQKDLLGMYVGQSEGAKFWLNVLTDLQNRGVEDILIACIDNLKGFPEAIESIFPQTEVQLCIVHQVRNSLRYVSSKDQRVFMKDLRRVYTVANRETAEQRLAELDDRWGKKYPLVIKSWNDNWDRLSAFFKYSKDIRRVIYTTNIIEGFHRQLRKVTKTKGAYPNDIALMKVLYLAYSEISKKWTMPLRNWAMTLSQLSIHFEGRLKLRL